METVSRFMSFWATRLVVIVGLSLSCSYVMSMGTSPRLSALFAAVTEESNLQAQLDHDALDAADARKQAALQVRMAAAGVLNSPTEGEQSYSYSEDESDSSNGEHDQEVVQDEKQEKQVEHKKEQERKAGAEKRKRKASRLGQGHKRSKKVHMCEECNKAFPSPSALKIHMRVHTNERPFPCLVEGCNEKFKQQDKLTRHMKSHAAQSSSSSKKTLWTCSFEGCGYSSDRRLNLERHMTLHKEERDEWVCKYPGCPHKKLYKKEFYLKQHYEQYHGEK